MKVSETIPKGDKKYVEDVDKKQVCFFFKIGLKTYLKMMSRKMKLDESSACNRSEHFERKILISDYDKSRKNIPKKSDFLDTFNAKNVTDTGPVLMFILRQEDRKMLSYLHILSIYLCVILLQHQLSYAKLSLI